MKHLPCLLQGAAFGAAFVSGVLAAPWLIEVGVDAGRAVADWLTDRIEIGRVL